MANRDNDDGDGAFEMPPPPPDSWPAWLWIGLGVLIFGGNPEIYRTGAAAVYFVLGGPLALALLGTMTARFSQLIQPALTDLFAGEEIAGRWLALAMHWLVLGMEGIMVMHLARTAIVLLSGGVLAEPSG